MHDHYHGGAAPRRALSTLIQGFRAAGSVFSFFLLALAAGSCLAGESAGEKNSQTGFLVVAGDRGFMGNEEIIDEFQLFASGRNASLVFVTDERTGRYLKSGVDRLLEQGAKRIVMLPLFISAADRCYRLVRRLLEHERIAAPVFLARPYGESMPATEDLADRLRAVGDPRDTRLIIAGHGAADREHEQEMLADWNRIAGQASAGFGFSSVDGVVVHDRRVGGEAEEADELKEQLALLMEGQGDGRTVMVPFHLGPKFDCMMSLDARLQRMLPARVQFVAGGPDACAGDPLPTHQLALWMQREANRSEPLAREDIGVVILAHGSDFNWNESMRDAVRPLMKDYKIEFAFSMADQPTIARAIRKLERRGAKAAVIVRVFGMEESFRRSIERMTGADIENASSAPPAHAAAYPRGQDAHGGGGAAAGGDGDPNGHGGHGGHSRISVPVPRIRTSLPLRTVGGIGASPLFAAAMLDRARTLSLDPPRETIILVAHGSGDDAQNERWQGLLEAMAEHMRKAGGDQFRAIRTATWREDWPEKRAPWVEKVRAMVAEAGREGGRAIVIPARTTGEGPEKKYLSGLEFELGTGFAPHPKFVQWVEEMIGAGVAQLDRDRSASFGAVRDHSGSFGHGRGDWRKPLIGGP